MSDPDGAPSRLAAPVLIAFGLPGLPAALLGLPLVIYVPTHYAIGMGLGLTTVGAVMLVARLWDAFSDPLVGWLSDRTRSRWGRRRPWLVAGLPVLLGGTWLLFVPPAGASAASMLFAAVVFYTGWTMVTIPHQAWGAELSEDYAERTRIMAMREGFGVAGIIVAVTLPVIVDALWPARPGETSEARALWLIAIMASLSLPIAGVALLALVPERRARARAPQGWREGFAAIRANAPFRRLAASYLMNGIANGLPASLFLLFVGHALGRPDWSGVFLVVYFVAALAGVPVANALARALGKHRAWSWSMLIACAAFAIAPWLGPTLAWLFLPICLVTGFALGADLVLPPAMQADVVDVDTATGGPGRAGLFFALWAMITKMAMALAVGLAFPLLAASGFAAEGENGPAQILALGAIYAWLPIGFKLAAVALMWNFPLTASAQAELRARLSTPGVWRRV